jgi:hypothetical protein
MGDDSVACSRTRIFALASTLAKVDPLFPLSAGILFRDREGTAALAHTPVVLEATPVSALSAHLRKSLSARALTALGFPAGKIGTMNEREARDGGLWLKGLSCVSGP